MRVIETHIYKRINKRTARSLYNAGHTIYLVPCRIWPNDQGPWIRPYPISKKEGELFDNHVNAYEYYNCNYNELGYYAAFYIYIKKENA